MRLSVRGKGAVHWHSEILQHEQKHSTMHHFPENRPATTTRAGSWLAQNSTDHNTGFGRNRDIPLNDFDHISLV